MAEYWDLYDIERNPLGRLHKRGDEIPEGEYHLVVEIWTRDDAGRFLISRRHPDKPWGLFWECTGGSVVAGEDSLTGAQRELEEELGIRVEKEALKYIFTDAGVRHRSCIYDTYEVRWNGSITDLTLQEGEVVDAKWVDYDELCALYDAGVFVPQLGYFRKWFGHEAFHSLCKR